MALMRYLSPLCPRAPLGGMSFSEGIAISAEAGRGEGLVAFPEVLDSHHGTGT